MIGFAQFQDDLKEIRHFVTRARVKLLGTDTVLVALARIERFAQTLENLDLHEQPERPEQEPQGAQPCGCNEYGVCGNCGPQGAGLGLARGAARSKMPDLDAALDNVRERQGAPVDPVGEFPTRLAQRASELLAKDQGAPPPKICTCKRDPSGRGGFIRDPNCPFVGER